MNQNRLFLTILLLVCMLVPVGADYTPILNASVHTDAAVAHSAKNVSLSGHTTGTAIDQVWFVWGAAPNTYSSKSTVTNISSPATFNTTAVYGLYPGATMYIRAGSPSGYGSEVSVVIPTLTPIVQSTYKVRSDAVIGAQFDILVLMGELPKAFSQQMGASDPALGRLIFWGFVLSCLFIVLYLRSENVMTPALLGLLIGWVLLSFVPGEFRIMGQALLVVALGALLFTIIKGRVR